MPNKGTTSDENKTDHPHPAPPPSEGEGEGGGWFICMLKSRPLRRIKNHFNKEKN
jgi:hypothetical protein